MPGLGSESESFASTMLKIEDVWGAEFEGVCVCVCDIRKQPE